MLGIPAVQFPGGQTGYVLRSGAYARSSRTVPTELIVPVTEPSPVDLLGDIRGSRGQTFARRANPDPEHPGPECTIDRLNGKSCSDILIDLINTESDIAAVGGYNPPRHQRAGNP